jgi:hypothetical protein
VTRPPWEVADVIRIAGSRFRERYGASLTWPQVKVLPGPLPVAVLLHRAAISMYAPVADISPGSPTTPVGTGIARSVRPALARSGLRSANRNCCR